MEAHFCFNLCCESSFNMMHENKQVEGRFLCKFVKSLSPFFQLRNFMHEIMFPPRSTYLCQRLEASPTSCASFSLIYVNIC